MSDSTTGRTCQNCGQSNVDATRVTATYDPRRIADLAQAGHGKRIIESRFRCRDCGHEFSEVEEHLF